MRVYRGNGLGDIYFQLVRDVTKEGREVTVRGLKRLEMPEPVTLVYEKPGHCWMQIPGRKYNPFFALAEVAWILLGSGNVEWISYFNSQMREYADPGQPEFHGSYGLRLRRWPVGKMNRIDQISEVVQKLSKDPFSTQAVMCLWDPARDNMVASKDYPCNNIVYYSLRDGKLDQTVVIRSNDLIWGTPTNAIQFSHIQALVAGELGVEIGKLTYVIQNLHYYFDLYKPTLATLLEQAHEMRDSKAFSVPGFCPVTDSEIQKLAHNLDYIATQYRRGVTKATPNFSGSGYWNQTIPQMIWLYTVLKERNLDVKLETLAERLLTLGEPLLGLALDFYSGTSNICAEAVREECLKQLQKPASATE